MTSDQTEKIAIRGLLIILGLLVVALLTQILAITSLLNDDDIKTSDLETIASISSLGVIALAIVGILSVYIKAKSKEDST